jgi:tyrosinase
MDSFEQPKNLARRGFVKEAGAVSLALVYSTMLGGCESLIEQIKNRPVRHRLRKGSPQAAAAIDIYKEAVIRMRALPPSDPRNWDAQAAIHGSGPDFNFCQHGTDHFFSWHRAYLFYFEKICQELTGEKSFGLPYWNWNQDPAMHPAFTQAGSPLDQFRFNTSVAGEAAFDAATLDPIFSDNNFFTFSSQLEGTPHNTVHNIVGGVMRTAGSPLDPIFWPHHCMVDYCWAKWNIELGNYNTNDVDWLDVTWDHFVDGKGKPAVITALSTVLMPFFSYRYESSPIGGFGAELDVSTLSARDLQRVEAHIRRGADIRIDIKSRIPLARSALVPVTRSFSARTRVAPADFSRLLESDGRRERVFLRVDYEHMPAENDFFVRVFINFAGAGAQTPTDDIHYAGSFAFFGTSAGEHTRHSHKTDFLVNVTDTLKNLGSAGLISAYEPISVQLVAVPVSRKFARPDMHLMLKDIELIVSTVSVHPR